jgi:hypothetical protein
MAADHAGAPGDQNFGACKRLRGDNLNLLGYWETWAVCICNYNPNFRSLSTGAFFGFFTTIGLEPVLHLYQDTFEIQGKGRNIENYF